MLFVELFFQFFRIGICAFGGGLATIPFLEELGRTSGWFTQNQLADMIAVSESTPGAMGINMSTYVGYTVASEAYSNNPFIGLCGGICATLGLVAPSIIVILIICQFLKKFKDSKYVKWVFYGLRAASFGLICAAAFSILKISIIDVEGFKAAWSTFEWASFWTDVWGCISNSLVELIDFKCLALALFIGIILFKYKKHPIVYIIIAAVIGIIFQF